MLGRLSSCHNGLIYIAIGLRNPHLYRCYHHSIHATPCVSSVMHAGGLEDTYEYLVLGKNHGNTTLKVYYWSYL